MDRTREPRVRATLKQVASEAGVSVCTASVVLNGSSSGSRISEPTRTNVLSVAQRLGYRANGVAQSLNTGRTHMIGLIPASNEVDILLGPHLQFVLNGIVNETEARGYDISLLTRCDQFHASELVDAVVRSRIDGVIVVAPRLGTKIVQLLKEEGVPYVVIDGDPELCDRIFSSDNEASVAIALSHLCKLGHRKIAHIAGPQDHYAARARKDAFFLEAKRLGLDVRLEWLQVGTFDVPSGVERMSRILNLPELPTAVFCANDEMAFGAIRAIQDSGRSVPDDIAVVGFDDVPYAATFHPPLTTVRQSMDEISRAAAAALISSIEQGAPIVGRRFVGTLLARKSTDSVVGE